MDALTLNLNPVIELTDEQFFQLCQLNELIIFERNADGTLVLMPLVGGTTSIRNASLTAQLGMWNRDNPHSALKVSHPDNFKLLCRSGLRLPRS